MGSGGKSGGGGSNSYDYYGTIAGVVCWGVVDELIAIIVDGVEIYPEATNWELSSTINANEIRRYAGRVWKCKTQHIATEANCPPNNNYWENYSFKRIEGEDCATITTKQGDVKIYWGTQTQTVDTLLTPSGNNAGDLHPDYKGVCYVILKDFLFGRERTSAPNVEVVVGRQPKQTAINPTPLDDGQANPVDFILEFLTNPNGYNLTNDDIDIETFQNVSDKVLENKDYCFCSPLITEQTNLKDLLDNFSELTDAYLTYNFETEQIEAKIFQHGVVPSYFHTIKTEDLTEKPQITCEGWSSVNTGIVATYIDRSRSYKQTTEKIDDLRTSRILGEPRRKQLSREWITRRDQVLRQCGEVLKTLTKPQINTKINVRREKARQIQLGDWVLLDFDIDLLNGKKITQFFKVTAIKKPRFNSIELTLDADETQQPLTYYGGEILVHKPETGVAAIDHCRLIEPTVVLANDGNCVTVLAERPNELISGCDIYFNTEQTGTFYRLGSITAFAMKSELTDDIEQSDVSFDIDLLSQTDEGYLAQDLGDIIANNDTLLGFIVQPDGDYIAEETNGYAISEIVSLKEVVHNQDNNYTITVLRGRQGTKPLAFTSGCELWIIPRSVLLFFKHSDFDLIQTNRNNGTTPDIGYFRLKPYTHRAERNLSDCVNIPFRMPLKSYSAPNITINQYDGTVAYVKGDIVRSGNLLYYCIADNTGQPVSNTTYWKQFVGDRIDIPTSEPLPVPINLNGVIEDYDNDLINYKAVTKKQNGNEILIVDKIFPSRFSEPFNINTTIGEKANTDLIIKASDSTAIKSEYKIKINTTGLGATEKVAAPAFYWNGIKLNEIEETIYGYIEIRCSTEGAKIYYYFANAYRAWTYRRLVTKDYYPVYNWGNPIEYRDGTLLPIKFIKDTYNPDIGFFPCSFAAFATKDGYLESDMAFFQSLGQCRQ